MYGYPLHVLYTWGVGQSAPVPAVPAWLASDAAIAQHARYMLQEAMAWLIGAGVTQRTIHQEVDRLLTDLQQTEPPFRTHVGRWHFDGTHWSLRQPASAATGWWR